jgi:hypothetical protein
MLGYEKIPDVWKSGIAALANKRFAFTQYSFNEIVASTQARALKVVSEAGGSVTSTEVEIPAQSPEAPALEQWDAGIPLTRAEISDNSWVFKGAFKSVSLGRKKEKFKSTDAAGSEATFGFEGTGVAIVGHCSQEGGRADVFVDDKKVGEIDAWIPKNTSDDDYWHTTGLPEGKHMVRIVVRNDADSRSTGRKVQIHAAIVYGLASQLSELN